MEACIAFIGIHIGKCLLVFVQKLLVVGLLLLFHSMGMAAPEEPSSTGLLQAGSSTPSKNGFNFSANGFTEQINQAKDVVTSTASDLMSSAMGFLGVPYKRGGNSAENGFDCSGFVVALYQQTLGLVLPRTAAQQAEVTRKIEVSELQPGDLVFFNTMRRAFSHVGVYMGDGKFIHSPRPGGQVRVEDMGAKYWQTRFNGARRVAPLENP